MYPGEYASGFSLKLNYITMNIESLNNWSATINNSRCHLGYYGSNVDWVMLDKSQREGG